MTTSQYISSVDGCLAEVADLLTKMGIALKQKDGYKAGKLTTSRNWCHIIDGDINPPIVVQNAHREAKTWRLFARFDALHSPSSPWDKVEQIVGKKPQGLISGGDVWGVSKEDLQVSLKRVSGSQVVKRLTADLQNSFHYARQRYC